MKVNLLDKDYNLDELFYNIQKFEAFNNRCPKYIVMNEQTVDLIESLSQYRVWNGVYFKHNRKYVNEIFGISIAYNESLDVGMVDIV
jgi:hypothetical protein